MPQLLLACAIITAMIGAAAALIRGGMWVWKVMRQLARLADDLTGEPARPGMPEGRPGVLDRLAGIETALGQVMPQLQGFDARLTALEAHITAAEEHRAA